MSASRLLVVAFGPFPRVPRNPSAEVARRLGADRALARRLGGAPRVLILRTAYASLDAALAPALAAGPAAVLLARVEGRAVNRASRLFPDASGRTTGGLALERTGPASRGAGSLARLALVALRRAGLDAHRSIDAGRYLCNASYYRALAAGVPALFLHIPPTAPARPVRPGRAARRAAESRPARLAQAFAAVAVLLALRARQAGPSVPRTGTRPAILPIVTHPDPRLGQVSAPVAEVTDATRTLLDAMLETMYAAPGRGLAAVQVGVLERLVVVDTAWKDGPRDPLFLVNPEIAWASDVLVAGEERCLSIPGVPREVARPDRVRVRYRDRDGRAREILAEGPLAMALQHEIDHLDGVLILDRAP